MKTYYYKTLRRAALWLDLDFYSIRTGRALHRRKGWVNFKLSDEAYNGAIERISVYFGAPHNKVRLSKPIALYERIAFNKYGHLHYNAGQDYKAEVRRIKKHMLNI